MRRKRMPLGPLSYRSCRGLAAGLALMLAPQAAVWADPQSDVAALEAQCEKAREEKIKPLREMEIAKCQADPHNDPDYCVRYWKDYGNAVRLPNGAMGARMFNDLPICLKALEARNALNLNGS